MTEQLDHSELVSIRELVISNSIQVDAMAMLLIEKGFFTKDEFHTKLKEVQMEYKSRDNA
ncbi:MAG: hypothetical protein P8X47_12245 [Ignavibacteriaceae bacterium]